MKPNLLETLSPFIGKKFDRKVVQELLTREPYQAELHDEITQIYGSSAARRGRTHEDVSKHTSQGKEAEIMLRLPGYFGVQLNQSNHKYQDLEVPGTDEVVEVKNWHMSKIPSRFVGYLSRYKTYSKGANVRWLVIMTADRDHIWLHSVIDLQDQTLLAEITAGVLVKQFAIYASRAGSCTLSHADQRNLRKNPNVVLVLVHNELTKRCSLTDFMAKARRGQDGRTDYVWFNEV